MGASDLHLWWSVYDYTPSSASGSRARQARDKRYWSVWVLAQFLQVGSALAIPSSILSSWLTAWRIGRRAPLLNGALKFAWLMERGALTWEGRAQVCLIDRNERAPVGQGALKENGTYSLENLMIQHTVSRWGSSGCVHEGCGGVDHWLQTGEWSLPDFLL